MKHVLCLLAVVLVWGQSQDAFGQGFIVPPERMPVRGAYAVKNVTIDATVRDQVAEVQLSQVFRNLSSRDMEVTYVFPVPADATITNFVLLVDGKELTGKMYPKDEARRIYESIVRSKKDPAVLEYVGYGALQTSVFPLPANGERKVTLKYTQVCRRDREATEFVLPLATGKLSSQPIEELKATVRIESKGRLKSVYSPTFSVNVDRPGDNAAVARVVQNHVVPADDFRLLWTLSDKPIGATIFSYKPSDNEDGYFLMLASPDVQVADAKVTSKSVVFVIDRSGSMAGKKIEQARNALKFVLNNLRDGDTYNIVAYDSNVQTFKPELQRYDSETRLEAQRYVDAIFDGGSTNIDGALKRAFELVGDGGKPSYILFLTDGLPTAGETNPAAIAANAKNANRMKARLFSFGVGFDVNARLLDQLSTENFGASEYVRPNEDIEAAVSKFYSKMTSPVLTDVKLELSGAESSRLYPSTMPDLFAGGQVIIVGRYRTPGDTTIRLRGKVGDREQTFEFPAKLAAKSGDETYAFVEKLWATRRVGEIINELDLKGKNQELLDELVRLSTKHGILTPYTAFLADERTDLHAVSLNRDRAERYAFESKESLAQNSSGAAGVNLRVAKSQMQQAAAAPKQGQQGYFDAAGNYQVEFGCVVVGNRAFYRRSGRWIDPSVTPEEEKKAVVVEQFSEPFFELARTNANLRRYLAMPEGCTVKMDGQVYQINAVKGG
jgi:Ca-activated chloride channel family protein